MTLSGADEGAQLIHNDLVARCDGAKSDTDKATLSRAVQHFEASFVLAVVIKKGELISYAELTTECCTQCLSTGWECVAPLTKDLLFGWM